MFKQVFDNIYMLSTAETGTFPSSYSFYIDDKVKTLIDTPLDKEFVNLFDNRPLDRIINTHFHKDHSGCNHLFPFAEVYAHPLDTPAMESAHVFSDYYGFNNPAHLAMKELFIQWLNNYSSSHITGYIEDGQIIDLGKTKLEVIHTPGHTPGHCVFYIREQGILFSGDIDLTSFGPWYGNVVSNVDDLIESIKKVINLNPKVILSGHKGVITNNVAARLKKYLDKVYENEEKILTALSAKPLTINELTNCKIIYGRWGKPTMMFAYFEQLSLERHLERLIKLDLVRKHDDSTFITNVKKTMSR